MILAIGDSNMYPACTEVPETPDPGNLVSIFSNAMQMPFRCWSKNGASNYWIQTHLDYFLADPDRDPDTFVLIGWTSVEREEWPWLYSNISVCGGPDFGIPEPMQAKYIQWKHTLTDDYMQACRDIWHERIYQVHEQLRDLSIQHLFWTTYDNFKAVQDRKDWHGNFYKPYDEHGCMCKFLDINGVDTINGDPFHYDQAAHNFWAQELYNYNRKHIL
jgi:hypothetical protein